MQIKVWRNFSKRGPNSTKRPSDSEAVTLEAKLKEETSVENPTFLLSSVDLDCNYCQAFGHYYFINDITLSTNGLYNVSCVQDLLATHRTAILNTSQFVTRSESDSDPLLNDPLIAPNNDFVTSIVTLAGAFITGNIDSGVFILKTFGDSAYSNLFNTYVLTPGMVKNLASEIQNPTAWALIKGEVFTEPLSAIISLTWYPLDYAGLIGELVANDLIQTGVPIKLGEYTCQNATGNILKTAQLVVTRGGWLNIPKYTDVYLNTSRFASCEVFIPYIGKFPVNMDNVLALDKLNVKIDIDLINGDASYMIRAGKYEEGAYLIREVLSVGSAHFGANMPLSATSSRLSDLFVTFPQAVQTGVRFGSGDIIGGVGSATSIISSLKRDATISAGGFSGGMSAIKQGADILVYFTHFQPSASKDDIKTRFGLPLYKKRVLYTLSGFCQCENASVSLPALGSDAPEVASILNGGFYIE